MLLTSNLATAERIDSVGNWFGVTNEGWRYVLYMFHIFTAIYCMVDHCQSHIPVYSKFLLE